MREWASEMKCTEQNSLEVAAVEIFKKNLPMNIKICESYGVPYQPNFETALKMLHKTIH